MSMNNVVKRGKAKPLRFAFGKGLLFTFFVLAAAITAAPSRAEASDSVSVKEIDYGKSTITIEGNTGDTEIYFSEGTKNIWEQIPGELNANEEITMDISWISATKNLVLKFKGNDSSDAIEVNLPKQDTKFKASFKKIDGSMIFTNAGDRIVQWRKKESGIWKNVGRVNVGAGASEADVLANMSRLKKELETLYTNGSSIVFRLAPVNGTASNPGLRPSKEVTVAIPKKSSAPSITIDGSKLSIGVKAGMEYRVVAENKSWVDCKKTESIPLSVIAPEAMYTDGINEQEVKVQFRTKATSSKQISMITTVTVPKQTAPPSKEKEGIIYQYTSTSTLTIQAKAASSTTPFEYTIVKPGETLDLLKATWTQITASTEITVKSDKAEKGSSIYIRKKTLNKSGDEKFALASKELKLIENVDYPTNANGDSLKEFMTVAGICTEENEDGHLQFTLYSPTKTTVSSISFHNEYNQTSLGTVACKSTVAENRDSSAPSSKKYIITTTIISTKGIEGNIDEKLFADITLANGDKIESTNTSGVTMYLYPKTVLNNGSNKDYIAEFDRVFMSKHTEDKKSFQFRLDFGMSETKNLSSRVPTEISEITYGGVKLIENTDFAVAYGTDTKDGKSIRTAVLTIYADKFEEKIPVKYRDTDTSFTVKLNNKEVLDSLVSMKLASTAEIKNAPIAFAFTQGSLKETQTVTVPGTGGSNSNPVTKEEEVNDYSLELQIFDSKYSVGIVDITWGDNGPSVHHSSKTSGGKIDVLLSNKKLNLLQTSTPSTTNNLIIVFDNGFKITTGCKVTVLKKVN